MNHPTIRLSLVLVVLTACSKLAPAPTSRDTAMHRDTPAHEEIDRAAVRADLARHRERQIERLEQYARRGEFPHNYASPASAHIFRDEAGRLCAVANLVHQDLRDDLVDATARSHNDLAIADVREGPMFDWILGSGLTQEELARIQKPSPPLARPQPVRRGGLLMAKSGTASGDAASDRIEVAKSSDEELMKEAVVRHLDEVREALRSNTTLSLDIATDRFIAAQEHAFAMLD